MTALHQRLLGTWQSHRAKTFATWKGYESLPLGTKQKLGHIFGHLQIRYTPNFVFSTLDGQTTREPYVVIAEDEASLVQRSRCPITDRDTLTHLHFETIRGRDYYWLGMERHSEWFRKNG